MNFQSQTSFSRILGGNIRRERLNAALTQEKLAEKSELNIRTLQKIEAGKINILVTTLARIRRAIGCEWTALLPSDMETPESDIRHR